MGHVFTPQEYNEGRIPTKDDYPAAQRKLNEGLEDLVASEGIIGATSHGSTRHTDWSIGSDIDVLVLLPDAEDASGEQGLEDLNRRITESTYVPLEFVPTTLTLAQTGNHTLDSMYVDYIRRFCRDGVVGQDPLPFISPRRFWDDPSEEVRSRLEIQQKTFLKTRTTLPPEYDSRHCQYLERLMRQPLFGAIDLLRLRRGSYPDDGGEPLSKSQCIDLYAADFPELAQRTMPHLTRILSTRAAYREFLAEGTDNPRGYADLLKEVGDLYLPAREILGHHLRYVTAQSVSPSPRAGAGE